MALSVAVDFTALGTVGIVVISRCDTTLVPLVVRWEGALEDTFATLETISVMKSAAGVVNNLVVPVDSAGEGWELLLSKMLLSIDNILQVISRVAVSKNRARYQLSTVRRVAF